MAKTKGKKKSSGRRRSSGREERGKDEEKGGDVSNPFEKLWNRRKFDVLGKKFKGEQKRIGKSRGDAIAKRKRTLLAEYQQLGKASTFIDRRFGEGDEEMAEEDKAMMRFQMERIAQFSRKSRFALGDDDDDEGGGEVLTHLGTAIDDYENDGEGNQDDDNFDDSLNREMVERLHFGGGFVLKKCAPAAEGHDEDHPKTKKEVMEEIIAKSKMHKAQRAKEKEEDEYFVKELDQQFKELQGSRALVVVKKKKDLTLAVGKVSEPERKSDASKGGDASSTADGKKVEVDDYEKMTKELLFDMRAHPSDRLKRPEEIAKEEKQRLEALERKRQRRMQTDFDGDDEDGGEENKDKEGYFKKRRAELKKRTLASGDDLGENFDLKKPGQRLVLNDDGNLVIEGEEGEDEEEEGDGMDVQRGGARRAERDDDDDDEEEEEEEEEDDESDGVDGTEDEEEDVDEEEADDEEDKCKYDKGWEQDNDDEIAGVNVAAKAAKEEEKRKAGVSTTVEKGKKSKSQSAAKEDMVIDKIKKAAVASAKRELPFVIQAPKTLLEFRRLVDGRSVQELRVAIDRICACNAISLAGENRKKMQIFYGVLLQYFAAIAGDRPLPLDRIDVLIQPLIEMSSSTPLFAAVCARERLMRMQQQLSAKLQSPGLVGSFWPTVRTLLLLRLWFLIFPPSDFEHPVCSPAMLIASQYLMRCPVQSLRDVATGAFLCSILLSVCSQGKRFCPEAINFLHSLLQTGLPNADHHGERNQKTATGMQLKSVSQLLVCTRPWLKFEDLSSDAVKEMEPLDFVNVLGSADSDCLPPSDHFRASLMGAALQCLHGFVKIYRQLSPFPEMFSLIADTLRELKPGVPLCIRTLISALEADILQATKYQITCRRPLRLHFKKPVPIKQFNPRFEDNFARGKDYDPDKERAERKKLQKNLKREAKGAARELRKDNYFMAEVKFKERSAAEEERKENYKKALAFLESQEAAFKSGQLGSKPGKKRHKK